MKIRYSFSGFAAAGFVFSAFAPFAQAGPLGIGLGAGKPPAQAVLRLDESAKRGGPAETDDQDADEPAPPPEKSSRGHRHHRSDDRVTIFSDNQVGADQAVAGDAIAIIGNTRVDGSVAGEAVAILGDNTIDGVVRGNAVAIMGDLTLGPNARVGGDAICIGGNFQRQPGARVAGNVVVKGIASRIHLRSPLRQLWLRPPGFGWVWLANFSILAVYALVAFLFPRAILNCGNMLVERPVLSLLASFLTLLVLPLLFVFLLVTLVGVPVAIFLLPAGFVLAWIFGKASFYALVGRILSHNRLPPWLGVIVGGLVCLIFFMIPVAGLMLSLAISAMMLGCVIAALFGSARRQPIATPPII
jgi:hypothetical protein